VDGQHHDVRFRTDLFKGTARDYDAFRLPYPRALIDDLVVRVPLTPDSTVLDLACGTGLIAFAFAPLVRDVYAVDQESEFLEFDREKSQQVGVTNIHWHEGTAEALALDVPVDLVGIGNAFHRFDRAVAARRLMANVRPGGCVALLWGGTPWPGETAWQETLQTTVLEWIDRLEERERDRLPSGWEEAMHRSPNEVVLRDAGFEIEGRFEFEFVERWTVERLIGFTYSTSILNRVALGASAPSFERDVRQRLRDAQPDGVFEQRSSFAYDLARSPQEALDR
jgi:ubiquinone/menaquinone biosynthesis C-methylase UbiE